jgi:hypothetical protein
VIGYQAVFGSLGSALAFNFNGKLVVINYNLYEFTTSPGPAKATAEENPGRLPIQMLPKIMKS